MTVLYLVRGEHGRPPPTRFRLHVTTRGTAERVVVTFSGPYAQHLGREFWTMEPSRTWLREGTWAVERRGSTCVLTIVGARFVTAFHTWVRSMGPS